MNMPKMYFRCEMFSKHILTKRTAANERGRTEHWSHCGSAVWLNEIGFCAGSDPARWNSASPTVSDVAERNMHLMTSSCHRWHRVHILWVFFKNLYFSNKWELYNTVRMRRKRKNKLTKSILLYTIAWFEYYSFFFFFLLTSSRLT